MKALLLGIVALVGTAVGVDYLAPHATAAKAATFR